MQIVLDAYGIEITTTDDGGGSIQSDLKDRCPHCGMADCEFDCDESQSDGDEDEDDVAARLAFNHMMDGIESLLLALACAGVELETPAVCETIETAVQACANAA